MNIYTTKFFSTCPNNGARIEYALRIESRSTIMAEEIIAKVDSLSEGFHEEIADDLLKTFGGIQTLTAEHHGVLIETQRAK